VISSSVVEKAPFSLFSWVKKIACLLEQRSGLLLLSVTALYMAAAIAIASAKLLWNDELFTFYIARLPTMADVYRALLTGAEQLPPLFFIITRAFTALFGSSPVAYRLPEILGFWLMSASLFWFVRSRAGTAYGLVAMLTPMLSGAFYFADEARPYGLVLGFAGLALLCWQTAAAGCKRTLSLVGLCVCLASALCCHYYAVLCWIPFLLGEVVRTVIKKRIDVWIWASLILGLLPLVLLFRLINAAREYSSHFWAKPHWSMAFNFYRDLLTPAILMFVGMLLILAWCLRGGSPKISPPADEDSGLRAHESAAVFGFLLIPLVGIVLAKVVTGAFADRYVMPAVIGVSVVIACSISVIVKRQSTAGVMLAALSLTLFAIDTIKTYRQLRAEAEERAMLYRTLQSQAQGSIPVVIAGPHLFLELSYLAVKQGQKPNFVFLSDTSLALRYTETDDLERGLHALRDKAAAPLNILDFHTFCKEHREFLVYERAEQFSYWLPSELMNEKPTISVAGMSGGHFLLRISAAKN
jgi:hypothetical protein